MHTQDAWDSFIPENENPKLGELRRKAMKLPLTPGVYIMRDSRDNIIYIGKAKALKNRVSQYFGSQDGHAEKVRRMVQHVCNCVHIDGNSCIGQHR